MSTQHQLPRSVVAFMRAHVDHLVKLRFILFLHSSPSGMTSVPMAARNVDVPKSQIRNMAKELADDNLVRISGESLELSPMSIEERLAIAELASWYVEDRTLVLDLLKALGRLAS